MKENSKSKQTPKGDRLNWTTLKEVQPIKLCKDLTVGKPLTTRDLSSRNNNNTFPKNILVP